MDGTTSFPERTLRFDLAFPPEIEPETVIDASLWTQPCEEATPLPLSAAEFSLARMDASDPSDRERRAFVEVETTFRCLTLVPIIPLEGIVDPSTEERLSEGLDTLRVDIDLTIGLGYPDTTPFVVGASF